MRFLLFNHFINAVDITDILIEFVYYGGLLTAMDAILATVADGRQAISEKTERPVELN